MASENPLNAPLVAPDARLILFSCNSEVMKEVGKRRPFPPSTSILDAPSCQSYADKVLDGAGLLDALEEEGIASGALPG